MPQSVESQVFDLTRLCQAQEVQLTKLEGQLERSGDRISALEKRVEEKDEADLARAQLAHQARRYAITTAVGVVAVLISLVALILSQIA